ncbi:MAG TPA: acyl carrier protein [Myxococcota bacterium]|nr:acyl carrier protein [Myxococcota bacterium]HRY95794.1 acyl carrier protein [Myxococcota bacterium]HSA21165.1 acyl carrier protein [Myxococcota bacterium]
MPVPTPVPIPTDTLERVRKRVAEVLALQVAEVRPESRLMDDLGAESLDLVELMYLLEQEFGLRLSREDMSLSAQLGIPEEEIHKDEVLTERALVALREHFPHARDFLKPGLTRRHLAQLLTVEEIARGVQKKLGT